MESKIRIVKKTPIDLAKERGYDEIVSFLTNQAQSSKK